MAQAGCKMNPEFYRRIAQQCRALLAQARTDAAKQQLKIWIAEFEVQAAAAERELTETGRSTEWESR
jgi:hypothetical protein